MYILFYYYYSKNFTGVQAMALHDRVLVVSGESSFMQDSFCLRGGWGFGRAGQYSTQQSGILLQSLLAEPHSGLKHLYDSIS